MTSFASFDGARLDYQDDGEGPAVLLLDGFASDTDHDWRSSGVWVALLRAGYRVLGLDLRGHGRSERLYVSAAYADDAMASDALSLLDPLN